MLTLPLHLAPGLLLGFMLALAVVPLAIIWLDERRKGDQGVRLDRLREDARLRAVLARAIGQETTVIRSGLRLPNA